MRVLSHKYFDKRFTKLPLEIQKKTLERLQKFRENPYDEILKNHALTGKYKGMRSIDITGDYRAIYDPMSESSALFLDIGTHSHLYK